MGIENHVPRVSQMSWQGWSAVRVDVDQASLVLIPELGAKIVSLVLAGDDRDFLWQDSTRPYRTMTCGDSFGDGDASGFDECFPTIGECPYPENPWSGAIMPDHGELWTARWQMETDGRTVSTVAEGVSLPYRFERSIGAGAIPGSFRFRYLVDNLSRHPLTYLWSAHPLFAARAGMRVLIPGHPRGRIVFAGGGRVTDSGEIRWPQVPTPAGGWLDYGVVCGTELVANDKVCVETPTDCWCALFDPERERFCGLRVEPDEAPFIAVCINHGWWPFTGRRGFWVALEPCTGFPDRLDEAAAAGRGRTIEGGESVGWTMDLVVGSAGSEGEVAASMAPAR